MPSKEPRKIQAMFGRIAPVYDLFNRVFSLSIDQVWRRFTVARALRASDWSVLDVACGTGDLTLSLRRRAKRECQVIGVDFCFPMLKLARRKVPLAFLMADGLRLPFRDGSFDLVTIGFGLRNMVDLDGAVAEFRRVLRPGGRLAVLEFTTPRNRVFRWPYLLYFRFILPLLGNLLSRSDAYRYLSESVLEWPGPSELARILRAGGFARVRFAELSLGIAALHIAECESDGRT